MDALKLCPEVFAPLIFELFRAGTRMGCVVPVWDESVLVHLFKKGDPADPDSYRAFRLVLRKIFEIVLEELMGEESPDELAQFGFQKKTSSLAPTALVLSSLCWKAIITILLDLVKAYDLVPRDQLQAIVDSEHPLATSAMVAMLLQPSQVWTQGDSSKLILTIFIGLTQGGPVSPRLYKKTANVLIAMVQDTVSILRKAESPMPIKAFADDAILQLLDDISAALALGAAGRWSEMTGQPFNLKRGKSACLVLRGEVGKPSGRRIRGEEILKAVEEDYLGVPLTLQGSTAAKTEKRVGAASQMLRTLAQLRVLVCGMEIRKARELQRLFVEAKWTFACFLVPMERDLENKLDAMEAGVFSIVLAACKSTGKRAQVAQARALLRLDCPKLARKIHAQQFVASLKAIAEYEALPGDIREKAKLTLRELQHVHGLSELVEDFSRPWDTKDANSAREKEWKRAFAGAKRQPPDAGEGKKLLPWALRLPQPWARTLAARYFLNNFPIFTRTRVVDGQKLTEKAVRTRAEKKALAALQMLHYADEESEENISEVMWALEVLRMREAWWREGRES